MKSKPTVMLSMVIILVIGLFTVPIVFAQESDDDIAEETTEAVTEEPTDDAADESADDDATPAAEPTEEPTANDATDVTSYTIQPGDTLYSIATRNGLTVTALANANNIVNPSLIYWGQNLVIPASDATGGPVSTPEPEPTDDDTDDDATPTAEPTEEPTDNTETYVVRTGDNLYRISLLYNTSVERLVQLNDIQNANLIFTGQTLTVPAL